MHSQPEHLLDMLEHCTQPLSVCVCARCVYTLCVFALHGHIVCTCVGPHCVYKQRVSLFCVYMCAYCVRKFHVHFLCAHVARARRHVHSVMCVQTVCAWCVCTHCVCKCVCRLGASAHSGGSSEVQGSLWWCAGEGLPGSVLCYLLSLRAQRRQAQGENCL